MKVVEDASLKHEKAVRLRIREPNKPFRDRFSEERFGSARLTTAEILGENVKRLRAQLDLSQADLAQALKTDQSAIGLIELRRANPTLKTLEKLASVLKTTVAGLLSEPTRKGARP